MRYIILARRLAARRVRARRLPAAGATPTHLAGGRRSSPDRWGWPRARRGAARLAAPARPHVEVPQGYVFGQNVAEHNPAQSPSGRSPAPERSSDLKTYHSPDIHPKVLEVPQGFGGT